MKRPRRTLPQELRYRLHRCFNCWRRSDLTITFSDPDDESVSVTHRICGDCARNTLDALAPVADEIGATFGNGDRVTYRPEADR